LGWH